MDRSHVFDRALPGHFYAVGVGPGAPDLVTRRAARLVQTADVLIAPRSAAAGCSLALEAVRDLIPPGQILLEHQYAMKRSEEETMANWGAVAATAADHCRQNRSVAQITIGDPLIYSTTAYLLPHMEAHIGAACVHVVPGISAFQSAAALFTDPLSIQEDRLMLMPATDLAAVARALDQCETLVLYKCAKRIEGLLELLERRGLADRARLVCYAEQGGRETIFANLRDAAQRASPGYMATAIIHTGRRKWNEEDTPQ
jgi:precorrin-2/cobalt-factor-2 C20-methyltransferase